MPSSPAVPLNASKTFRLHQLACNGETAKHLPQVEWWSKMTGPSLSVRGCDGTSVSAVYTERPQVSFYTPFEWKLERLGAGSRIQGRRSLISATIISGQHGPLDAHLWMAETLSIVFLDASTPRMLNALCLQQSPLLTYKIHNHQFCFIARFEGLEDIGEAIRSARYRRNAYDSIHALP
jgi:hypothetical protein